MAILKIYKTQLTPTRNALLDNIEEYLSNVEDNPSYYTGSDMLVYTEDNYQFVKPDLDATIKIKVPLDNNSLYESVGNYVRIEQENNSISDSDEEETSIWYYFIISSKWLAQRTLELTLSMDTINTFSSELLNKDNWSDKTSIIREHIDRFERNDDGSFLKKVDRIGESISSPYLLKGEDTIIEEPNSTNTPEWYLVYKTENAAISEAGSGSSSNRLKCYIYPKTSILYQQTKGSGTGTAFIKTPGDFTNNKIYGITSGGASFADLVVYGRYFNYTAPNGNTIKIKTPSDESEKWYPFITISGSVNVGDSFSRDGSTYTCYAVVWYKNDIVTGDGSGLNLPIGLFKSSTSSLTYYAVYLSTVNGVTVDTWYFRDRNVWWSFDWKMIQGFRTSNNDRIDTNGSDLRLKDVESESDWTITLDGNSFDTNWSRNPIYFTTGSLSFTSDVDYIYQLDYQKATPTAEQLVSGTKYYTNLDADSYSKLSCIDSLDRTDSTLVKILALPYCPTEISISSGSISSGSFSISFDTNVLTLEPETAPGYTQYFRLVYDHVEEDFGKNLNPIVFDYSAPKSLYTYYYNNEIEEKKVEHETKLLNSDFHKDLFVYDDVSKSIRREDLGVTKSDVTITPFYKPTNTLGSSMLFNFKIKNASYSEISDWDKVLISTRNNELPIYNNDYLNYLRYGYGTEKTNLEATVAAQRQSYQTNAAFSAIGGVVGGAGTGAFIGAKFGGVGAIPGAIIGAAVGLATSLIKTSNTINTAETNIEKAQRNLAQKMTELQHTASTTSNGNSAIDLMSKYTSNRLHYMTYDMPELLKEAVYDKIFYCGYSHPVQEKPLLNSRLFFNFLQCEPIFKNEGSVVYQRYIIDIKERFNSGITIYHNQEDLLSELKTDELLYDWEQQYENWENFERIIPKTRLRWIRPLIPNYGLSVTYHSINFDSNPWLEDFKPQATNNYRFKLTYILPGTDEELKYPYSDDTDYENGYTLNTTVKYSDFAARGIEVVDGIVILARIIDITNTFKSSNYIQTVTKNRIKTTRSATEVLMTSHQITTGGTTYYEWKPEDGSSAMAIYTTSRTPTVNDPLYRVTFVPDEEDPVIITTTYTVSSINGFGS